MFDVQSVDCFGQAELHTRTTFGLKVANLIINKPCHFGVVSYEQTPSPETRNLNTDLVAAQGLH